MTATEAPPPGDGKPCAGLSVVEVAIGVSDLGLGMAGGVPGMMLADLGADVTRVVGTSRPAIDRHGADGARRGLAASAQLARRRLHCGQCTQNAIAPHKRPLSSMSTSKAAGFTPRPGIVCMSPSKGTSQPDPV